MKRIIERIKGFDIKRMFKMINVIKNRSGESFVHIFLDIFRCWIKFGSGYMDYYLFYFEDLSDTKKATYINVAVNKDYVRHCNNPKFYHYFNEKPEFLERYKEFIKRDYIDLRKCSYEEYIAFATKHKEFIVKPIDGLCGKGVELIKTNGQDLKSIYDTLISNEQLLLEERIKQHRAINEIYDGSINTIRIVTLNKNGKVSIMFRAMRIGNKGKVVDNFNNGGLLAVIDEDGVIRKPVLDKDNNVYTKHPMTNTSIVGFKIPRFNEIISLCEKLALVTPEIGLTGWDIAVSDDGLDVVEGNQIPGYDIYQSREQLDDDQLGIKEKFDDAIYPEKKDKKIYAKGHTFSKFHWVFLAGLLFDLLFGALNISAPMLLVFIVTYIFMHKHIDTRKFYKTIIYILIFGFIHFLYNYVLINYLDIDNFINSSFFFELKTYPIQVILLFVKSILLILVLSLLCLYFILPTIDKLVEKINYKLGNVLSIFVVLINLFFVLTIIMSFLLAVGVFAYL